MQHTNTDRRRFLGLVPAGLVLASTGSALAQPYAGGNEAAPKPGGDLPDHFPRQGLAAATQVVRLSHFDLETVTRLVSARPALARASYDLGYGDWESAIGAASHVGRMDIAEVLIAHGARPDVFTFAMMGDVDAVRAMVDARPAVRRVLGPHGITLLQHARIAGDRASSVADYLLSKGDANEREPRKDLPEDRLARYTGTYRFAPGDGGTLVVGEARGNLRIGIASENMRTLYYQGGDAFAPAGSAAVRVMFGGDGAQAMQVVVHDPEPIVTATRA